MSFSPNLDGIFVHLQWINQQSGALFQIILKKRMGVYNGNFLCRSFGDYCVMKDLVETWSLSCIRRVPLARRKRLGCCYNQSFPGDNNTPSWCLSTTSGWMKLCGIYAFVKILYVSRKPHISYDAHSCVYLPLHKAILFFVTRRQFAASWVWVMLNPFLCSTLNLRGKP
jgi:hypothetical protein